MRNKKKIFYIFYLMTTNSDNSKKKKKKTKKKLSKVDINGFGFQISLQTRLTLLTANTTGREKSEKER